VGESPASIGKTCSKIWPIEIPYAAQAFEFRKPIWKSGVLLGRSTKKFAKKVAFAQRDRGFSEDIEKGIEYDQRPHHYKHC